MPKIFPFSSLAAVASSPARARPRSASFTVPALLIIRFFGLTSRWMKPLACAWLSALAAWRAMRSASASGIRRFAWMRSNTVSPSMYSITK